VSRVEAAFAALRARTRLEPGEAAGARRTVYVGAAIYAVVFLFAAVLHYVVFATGRGDLGNMVQAIWNTLHGHFLEGTTLHGHQTDRLGSHVDPLLLLLAPFFFLSGPLLLPVVQALAVASGALPVFWLARKHLNSPRAGAHFAFAYLLYPVTQFAALTPSSFHSVALSVPLLLFAIWFLDEDRLVAFSLVGLLAFTTKEEIPLAVGCLGIWYALRQGRRLVGVTIFVVGLSITLFNFLWVIPHFSPSGTNPFASRYTAVGGTPGGMVHKLFTDPLAFVHAVGTAYKVGFVVLLIVPFLGLWLLEPLLLLGALPDVAINLLSNNPPALFAERAAPIIPFVVAASIFGATRFKRHARRLSLWILAGTAFVALYSPLRSVGTDLRALGSPRLAAKEHAVGLIPDGVRVSASNLLAGHLSARRYIFTFPYAVRSRWIAVDIDDASYANTAAFKRAVRRYESNANWQVIYSSHGITVLHKRPAPTS
jgi:uncharacterized membrane protein